MRPRWVGLRQIKLKLRWVGLRQRLRWVGLRRRLRWVGLGEALALMASPHLLPNRIGSYKNRGHHVTHHTQLAGNQVQTCRLLLLPARPSLPGWGLLYTFSLPFSLPRLTILSHRLLKVLL